MNKSKILDFLWILWLIFDFLIDFTWFLIRLPFILFLHWIHPAKDAWRF